MTLHVGITEQALDYNAAAAFVRTPQSGAVVVFGGTTRADADAEGVVTTLEYEAHEAMAVKSMTRIAEQAIAEHGAHRVYIVHRVGSVAVLQESILVAVSAGHRAEGWEAATWVLEQVKAQVEVWKKEVYDTGRGVWMENKVE